MSEPFAQKIISLLAESQKISPAEITLDASFEDLGIDSLSALNLIADLESEFNIIVPDEEAMHISSVRQMVECLQRLLAEKPVEVCAT